MRSYIFYIIFIFFCLRVLSFKTLAVTNDSLDVMNIRYDSILKSEEFGIKKLFYKHNSDVLINNLGTYGSKFYFLQTKYLYDKSLLEDKNSLKSKYFTIIGAKPYTNISYINASRKEQIISICHMQQLGRLLKLDFDLDKTSSPGIYNNQEANTTNLKGNLSFNSKDNLYKIQYFTYLTRNFYEENGGIINQNNFEESLYEDTRNYDVYLQTSNSYVKSYKNGISQKIKVLKFNGDTLNSKGLYIGHKVYYYSRQKVFFDNEPKSQLYETILIDSNQTIDSVYLNNISNELSIEINKGRIDYSVFYKYDKLNYFQSYGIDTVYHNDYIGIRVRSQFSDLKLNFIAKYGLSGYREKDKELGFDLKQNKQNWFFDYNLGYYENEPDLKYVNYTSNHFDWKNYGFVKQKILKSNIEVYLKKHQLEVGISGKIINNMLFYDTVSNASQSDERISFATFSLAKDYSYRKFNFRTAVIYQTTTNSSLVPLPELTFRQVFYYQKKVFKDALKVQLGFGMSYSTGYYGYSYMPALGEFYVQNDEKLGYYPNIDVFINTYLKRAQIFLKYEHVNSGFSPDKSYSIPGYPQLNRSLKFGVSWNLFD